MKIYCKAILIIYLLFIYSVATGQEIVVISSDMFAETDQIVLDDLDGWIFQKGNEAKWAEKEIDISNWIQLKPSQLSVKNVDEHGKIEGWFRLKLRMDSTVADRPLFWYKTSFEAVELYVDGELVHTYGKILENSNEYEPYVNFKALPIPADLGAKEHLIAIHLVESTYLFPKRLKSQLSGPWTFLSITGQEYYAKLEVNKSEANISKAIVLSLCILLSLLFWIFVWQNRKERMLLLIAVFSSLFSIAFLAGILAVEQTSFYYWWIYFAFFILFIFATMGILPLVVSQIFTYRVSKKLRLIFIGQVILGIANMSFIWAKFPLLISAVICFSICSYFIYAYWKLLSGAQWAIVGGIGLMLVLLISTLLSLILGIDAPVVSQIFGLPLPLSMLIYVSIRFREMLNEVRRNADEVLKISAEKQLLLKDQNDMLEDQVKSRTKELTQSLENLKATQAQLIQSEKMASLGELTAGIAHEIQNPLNFVNNFSEVNQELADELKEELAGGHQEQASKLADDIKDNSVKIHEHGKRADAIVKSMLQHSRTSSGVKELTDINNLCDEYLRLAYHGMRAKDKSFSPNFKIDFDETIPNLPIVPEDIGRVILNLINNAFYAVHVKTQNFASQLYNPMVTVATKNYGEKIEIMISDNGPGIPIEIKDKIFQPFFTTKPTGQGTGLGLSLSYDIVKAHGGEIVVDSTEDIGTEFKISLPVNSSI